MVVNINREPAEADALGGNGAELKWHVLACLLYACCSFAPKMVQFFTCLLLWNKPNTKDRLTEIGSFMKVVTVSSTMDRRNLFIIYFNIQMKHA